jgi:L-ribulose-5-phosphate 3-epimerase
MGAPDRRCFLKSTAALAALGALRPLVSFAAGAPKSALSISMLPPERPMLERFRLALAAGFSAVEMRTMPDRAGAEQVREAAERSGLRIHAVVNAGRQRCPLSSPDRDVVRQGVAIMQESLRNARLWGADAVLIAPSTAGPRTSYRDAWTRSQKVIGEQILPLARDLDVVIAIEEVWDGFVIGPSEFGRYVDAFDSPWVKASFDIDRVVFYAAPQDWIRALGPRLVNVRARHIRVGAAESAGWMAVRGALREIAYDGWVTTEIAGDDASVRDVATALRRHMGA